MTTGPMKITAGVTALAAAVLAAVILSSCTAPKPAAGPGCLIGAFLGDDPSWGDINEFRDDFGRKPSLIMLFIEWGSFVPDKTIADVYSGNGRLIVTWEPWKFATKEGIDYDGLIAGTYDGYIADFAGRLKKIKKDVYLRFAHEMNGDWYPWSAAKLGADKYAAVYRHVKDVFDAAGADNVRWVFSVNWEDVPQSNSFTRAYPGDAYVDHVGIDGYNWGTSQDWSRWMSFKDIFGAVYGKIAAAYTKPVIITEFGSSSEGGDKAAWIRQALADIQKMDRVKAFVLFNEDKETDWGFDPDSAAGKELKRLLDDPYFR